VSIPRSLVVPSDARCRRLVTQRFDHAAITMSATGNEARGTAVIVPGFTGSKEDFLPILEPLAVAGYNVTTYDQRGQFESPDRNAPTSIDVTDPLSTLAADLLALIDTVSPNHPVHLVGHSMGGLVARAATLAQPARMASLTLLCSGPGALPEDQRPVLEVLGAALESVTLEQVWEAKVAFDQSQGIAAPPADIEEFLRRRFLANTPEALAAKARLLTSEPDRTTELAAVTAQAGVPVMVLHGVDDDAWPIEEQVAMAVTLGAEICTIDDAGHSPAVERPVETAAALVDFWNRSVSQPAGEV